MNDPDHRYEVLRRGSWLYHVPEQEILDTLLFYLKDFTRRDSEIFDNFYLVKNCFFNRNANHMVKIAAGLILQKLSSDPQFRENIESFLDFLEEEIVMIYDTSQYTRHRQLYVIFRFEFTEDRSKKILEKLTLKQRDLGIVEEEFPSQIIPVINREYIENLILKTRDMINSLDFQTNNPINSSITLLSFIMKNIIPNLQWLRSEHFDRLLNFAMEKCDSASCLILSFYSHLRDEQKMRIPQSIRFVAEQIPPESDAGELMSYLIKNHISQPLLDQQLWMLIQEEAGLLHSSTNLIAYLSSHETICEKLRLYASLAGSWTARHVKLILDSYTNNNREIYYDLLISLAPGLDHNNLVAVQEWVGQQYGQDSISFEKLKILEFIYSAHIAERSLNVIAPAQSSIGLSKDKQVLI